MKKRKITKDISGITFMFNNLKNEDAGLFFQNYASKGKPLKSDFICLTKKSILSHGVIGKNRNHMCYDLDYKLLKRFVAKVEKDKKYWEKWNKQRKKKKLSQLHNFFISINPELSFFIKTK